MSTARKPAASPKKNLPAKPKVRSTAKKVSKKGAVAALAASAKRASSSARARAEDLLAEIARRKVRIAEDFYEIGEALRELLHKKLFLTVGYKSFQEMLQARAVMSISQANRLITLVSSMPREKALAVGSEKAFLLVDYAKATPEPDTAAWLLDEGKLPGGKKIADASTREIVAATKAVRAKHGTAKAKSDDQIAAEKEARSMQAALHKRGAKSAIVSTAKRDGEWWIRLEVKVAHAKTLQ